MSIIEIKNLEKSYKTNSIFKRNKINVLKNINLQIFKGEIFGLLGENGSGKSTLIKIISGLVEPDKGSVNIKSSRISLVNTNSRSFYWRLTGLENLEFFSNLFGLSNDVAKKNIYNLADLFSISKKLNTPFRFYSSGEMQIFSLIRGLIAKPDLLLLDEPCSNLDYKRKNTFINYLNSYVMDEQASVVWCSHDSSELYESCNRLAILDQKKLVDLSNNLEPKTCNYLIEINIDDINKIKKLNQPFKVLKNPTANNHISINFYSNNNLIADFIFLLSRENIKIFSLKKKYEN